MRTPNILVHLVRLTPAAGEKLPVSDIIAALERHERYDWGHCTPEDWKENYDALMTAGETRSVYYATDGTEFCVVTEPNDDVTTVSLSEEH